MLYKYIRILIRHESEKCTYYVYCVFECGELARPIHRNCGSLLTTGYNIGISTLSYRSESRNAYEADIKQYINHAYVVT